MRLRTRSVLSWFMLVLGVVGACAVAYGAYSLASYAWDQVVSYKSPYVREPGSADTSPTTIWVPPSLTPSYDASAPILAKRVVLVIVDGMRLDVSREQFATLNKLRTYGADIELTAPQPSLSYPNWTTILSGANQNVSGVTTNWFKSRAPVPTIMDVAREGGRRVEIVGPEDFATLLGVEPGPLVSLRPWPKGGYLSGTLIDDTLRIAAAEKPDLIVLHLPDLDEAGHASGGASQEYKTVAKQIDVDLARLVDGLQRPDTAFIVVADHGHINTGGHGGWETVVTQVPGVFAGAGIKLGTGTGQLEQVAPTVSVLMGLPAPPYAVALALRPAIATADPSLYAADNTHHVKLDAHLVDVIGRGESLITSAQVTGRPVEKADRVLATARDERLSIERERRVLQALGAALLAVLVCFMIGFASWRALAAALVGTAAYYAVYNALFFWLHHYNWSLSAFNTETYVKSFMNGRMVEAIISGVVAVAMAAAVYPYSRVAPRGPRDPWFLSGWLALAPATVLVIEATLALQVAWYYWYYGVEITWILPNFMWAFKADLDMVQMTALAAVAVFGPLVTYLVGRYHPRVAGGTPTARAAASKT